MCARKFISISLYGSHPVYVLGALANAHLVPQVFPGWTMVLHCCLAETDSTPFEALGCLVVGHPRSKLHSGMFWRFLSAWDLGAERVLFRDADSRLNPREAAAVQAWERSGLDAHCMMDHPHHSQFPISGGMWGIKTGVLGHRLREECVAFGNRRQQRLRDMIWLRNRVHPVIQGSLLRHSSVPTKWPSCSWPDHLACEGFVGQQYNGEGNPVWPPVGG